MEVQSWNRVSLPEGLSSHPLISQQWFYTVPRELCDRLENIPIDSERWAVELDLANRAEAIPGCVGFLNGTPLSDTLLRPTPTMDLNAHPVADYLAECRAAGFNTAGIVELILEQIPKLLLPQRAYLGWLWTEPNFLADLQRLQHDDSKVFTTESFPPHPIAPHNGSPPQHWQSSNDGLSRAIQQFCLKWRLNRIVGPATVVPLSLQFPVPLPGLAATQTQTSGSLLFIPDIAPLPSREELRALAGTTVQQTTSQAPHLKEWFELVAVDTQGKKPIEKFARWYPLQHYLRVLYAHYADDLSGHQNEIEGLLGNYLNFTEDQLRRDLRAIRQRLNRTWFMPASRR